jgi:polyketide cyclase/dehydrase/lipid transport protein
MNGAMIDEKRATVKVICERHGGGTGRAPGRDRYGAGPMEQHASVKIRAAPETLYDLIADVTRMGAWSPECYRCEWLDGYTRAEVGARFKGYNRAGPIRWSNVSEVVVADRGRELAWLLGGTEKRYSLWRYTFEAVPGGALVTESFHPLRHTLLGRLAALPLGGERHRQKVLADGILDTLARLKAAAEALDHK